MIDKSDRKQLDEEWDKLNKAKAEFFAHKHPELTGLAFPVSELGDPGLTKRELFAAMILTSFYTHREFIDSTQVNAQHAVRCADALIDELAKEKK